MAADVHNAEIALLGHHRDCHSVRNYNKMTYNSMTSLTGKLHDVREPVKNVLADFAR